jgi:hypothetical protein
MPAEDAERAVVVTVTVAVAAVEPSGVTEAGATEHTGPDADAGDTEHLRLYDRFHAAIVGCLKSARSGWVIRRPGLSGHIGAAGTVNGDAYQERSHRLPRGTLVRLKSCAVYRC